MKKLYLLATSALLGLSLSVSAAVVITETPVELQRQGDIYIAPSTAKYYYYSNGGTRYVCTNETVAVEKIDPITLNVTIGSQVVSTKCYPATYFVTEAQ